MQMLKETFKTYVETAQKQLVKKGKEDLTTKGLHLFINEPMELNTLVSKLEEKEEFIKLLKETKRIFDPRKDLILFLVQVSAPPFTANPLNPFDLSYLSDEYSDDMWWKIAIHNFSCRSGFYTDIFDGRTVDFDKLFLTFCETFEEEQSKIKYLLPLAHVTFFESYMTFKNFSIRKFDHDEFNTMLQNEINLVFYKYAFGDTKGIEDYWYICFDDTKNVSQERDKAIGGEEEEGYCSNDYGLYPKKAEFILKCLSLYPWEEKCLDTRSELGIAPKKFLIDKEQYLSSYYKFNLPFVIEVHETPFCFPPEPANSYKGSLSDVREIDFNNIETEQFNTFIKRYAWLIEVVKEEKEWRFLDNAINFLFKAFFSKGMESLLWNIIAIESLIGERGETAGGITEILAERIAKILGDTADERKELRRRFEKLYGFRSRLVHGSNNNEEIKDYYYFLGRSLARSVVQRFLDCVEIHIGKIKKPNRGNIISSITSL